MLSSEKELVIWPAISASNGSMTVQGMRHISVCVSGTRERGRHLRIINVRHKIKTGVYMGCVGLGCDDRKKSPYIVTVSWCRIHAKCDEMLI